MRKIIIRVIIGIVVVALVLVTIHTVVNWESISQGIIQLHGN